jgi:hypothetical protein
MTNVCKHAVAPFFDDVFSGHKEPTEEQVNEYKLYQCGECHRWFSFLGVTLSWIRAKSKR